MRHGLSIRPLGFFCPFRPFLLARAARIIPLFSPEYEITRGDKDYFRLYAPRRMWLGIGSRGSTDVKGWLYNQDGLVIDEDDNGRDDGRNFLVLGLVDSGTYYLRVTGARTSTAGSYSLSVGTGLPDGAGKPVAQAEVERIKAALLDAQSVNQ